MADALRTAVERTLAATAGSRERTADLLDEVARRGRGARAEVARRGRRAREGVARRGQEAGSELARRLEALERRLASIEDTVRGQSKPKAED